MRARATGLGQASIWVPSKSHSWRRQRQEGVGLAPEAAPQSLCGVFKQELCPVSLGVSAIFLLHNKKTCCFSFFC